MKRGLLSGNVSVLVGALLVPSVNDDVLVGGLDGDLVGTELGHVDHHLEGLLVIFDAGDEFSQLALHTAHGIGHSHVDHSVHHVHGVHIHTLHPRYGADAPRRVHVFERTHARRYAPR